MFIIQHIQVFCLGILIAAAVAIWAINEVEKTGAISTSTTGSYGRLADEIVLN